MNITRDVILDILPLYLAGEASQDTRDLVEEYLKNDQELAILAKRTRELDKSADIDIPLRREDQMKAYQEAQRVIQGRTVVWGAIIAAVFLAVLGFAALVYFMGTPVP